MEVATPDMWDSPLYGEEQALIKNSVEKRKKEFSAGRACARKVLHQLGIDHYPLLADRERVPLWPENILGSISHTEGSCLAVATKKGRLQGIGIDVERINRSVYDIKRMICVPTELDFLARLNCDEKQLSYLMLIFSAKESVYKALYPSRRMPFEFNDFRIRIDTLSGCFRVELLIDIGPCPRLIGRYFFVDNYVFTSCEYLA